MPVPRGAYPLALTVIVVQVLSGVIFVGCGGHNGVPSSEVEMLQGASTGAPRGELFTATIGPAGGKLSGQGLTLTVPAATFATDRTLTLQHQVPGATPGPGCVSGTYTITGLPSTLRRKLPVTVSPIAGERLGGFSFLSMRTASWAPSAGAAESNRVLDAQIKSGKLTGAIPATSDGDSVSELDTAQSGRGSVRLSAFSRWRALTSRMNHFRVVFHLASCDESGAAIIGDCAENAWGLIQNAWGFSWARRTSWPADIQVHVGAEGIAAFVPCRWTGANGGSIEVNSSETGSDAEVRAIGPAIEHEVLHLAQSLYDTRNRFTAATAAGPWLWMDEATATLFEYYRGQQLVGPTDPLPLPSTVVDYREFVVKHALEFPPGDPLEVRRHGYGAAAFMRAALSHIGQAGIGAMYADHLANPSFTPVQCLANRLGSSAVLEEVFEEFVDRWVAGKVFAGQSFPTLEQVMSARAKEVVFDANRVSAVVSRSVGDLSILPILIRRAGPRPTGGQVDIMVSTAGLPAGDRSLLAYRIAGTGSGKTITRIGGVANFPTHVPNFEKGSSTLLVVVNHSARLPYTSGAQVKVGLQLTPIITAISPTSGGPGTHLTVDGYGFGAAQGKAVLTLGGATMVPTSWSGGKVEFVVPDLNWSSGPKGVVITVPGPAQPDWPAGVVSRSNVSFTYVRPPSS